MSTQSRLLEVRISVDVKMEKETRKAKGNQKAIRCFHGDQKYARMGEVEIKEIGIEDRTFDD